MARTKFKGEVAKVNVGNIFKSGVLIHATMGTWGCRTKLKEHELGSLPKEIVRGVRDLLVNKDALQEIVSFDNKTRNLLRDMSIPFVIDGVFFIPGAKIVDADEMLKDRLEQRKELVEAFISEYDAGKDRYKEKYKRYYNESKYPTKEELRFNKFRFAWRFFKMEVPDKDLLPTGVYQEEFKKIQDDLFDMKSTVKEMILKEVLEKAARLKEQSGPKGKPNQRTINNIFKFFSKVEEIYADFIDEEEVKEMIENFKKLVDGVDANDLRNESKKFRTQFSNQVKNVLADATKINTESGRAIDL